jgi:ribosomal protein S18 acetylase RimI-like enzyme
MNAPEAPLVIEAVLPDQFKAIWEFFQPIVAAGETYSFPMDCSFEQGKAFWFPEGGTTYIAKQQEKIVGSFYLKPNQPGLGNHVANAGYMVHPQAGGQGIGKAMALFSLEAAKRKGFTAMQFNYVVSSNKNAVALWQKLGFTIIGTSPKSFRRKDTELIDTYILHRFL